MKQNGKDPTQTTIEYGKALVQAIKAFRVLEPKAGWFERWQVRLLKKTYQDRLRQLVVVLPADVADEILKG